MTEQEIQELLVTVSQTPKLRKFFVNLVLEEMGGAPTAPRTIGVTDSADDLDMITYEEAAILVDRNRDFIYKGISKAHFFGKEGWVSRQGVIDYIMGNSPYAKRKALRNKLDALERRAAQPPLARMEYLKAHHDKMRANKQTSQVELDLYAAEPKLMVV